MTTPSMMPLLLFSIGAIFAAMSLNFYKNPPKKINSLIGYRTSSSMKSQERWDFSQKYSSKWMMRYGGLLLLASVVLFLLKLKEPLELFIGVGLLAYTVIAVMVKTERAIRAKFGNGQ